jgi:hypothetical protein
MNNWVLTVLNPQEIANAIKENKKSKDLFKQVKEEIVLTKRGTFEGALDINTFQKK